MGILITILIKTLYIYEIPDNEKNEKNDLESSLFILSVSLFLSPFL